MAHFWILDSKIYTIYRVQFGPIYAIIIRLTYGMKSIQLLAAELAFQADRKILHLEEEDHYRMDIPAVGILSLPTFHSPQAKSGYIKRFVVTGLALFMLLFSITNYQAYSQIFMANIQAIGAQEIVEEEPLLTVQEPAPLLIPDDNIMALNIIPTSYEDRIIIPSINVNSGIIEPKLGLDSLVGQDWNALEEQIRQSLLKGVVHYPGTAEPGDKGNVFLTGHSSNVFWEKSIYNSVFALLPRIEEGDDIYITFEQQNYHYRVTSKREVSPKDVSVLEQGDGHSLTMMTCTPVGTNLKRLVVTAELIE